MKLHRFDPLSFIAGLIATGVGLAFLIPEDPTDVVGLIDDIGAWFWPVVLVVIGIAILAPLMARSTEKEDSES